MLYNHEKTKNISFPLGGIGTGSIGLAGNGELCDWEIFNRPNKNSKNGYSHFAIKVSRRGKSIAKVLQGDTAENLMGISGTGRSFYGFGFGPRNDSLAGFPHFREVSFEGSFPIARLTFSDRDFPAVIRLCAFNPLIPHNDFDSSLPAAFFEWEIENITDDPIEVALAGTLRNPAIKSHHKAITDSGVSGIFFGCAELPDSDPQYSDLCLATDSSDTVMQTYWYRGAWMDSCTTYWRNLLDLDRMPARSYETPGANDHGTVVSHLHLPPKEKASIRYVIAWNVPTAHNYWNPERRNDTWRNYYATKFRDSHETAAYALKHFSELFEKTTLFSDELQSCSLPEAVKSAVSANLAVLKSPTVLRLEDGSFWAWEGCAEKAGSCMGTCQHVWNYAYALPFLFPRLERSIREITLNYALQPSGATSFRVDLPPKSGMSVPRACLDGQMGEVIKCYREWKLSGNNDWLRRHADGIFRMLEYAWSPENPDGWDADMDGVLEGRQHHTLDMELFGPSSWLQGFYLLALNCGIEMAEFLGDTDRATLYTRLYQNGKAWTNEHLFNGRYFQQKLDLTDRALLDRFDAASKYWNEEAGEIKYQIADGCIIDQMLADWHAHLIGLPCIFDPAKKKQALEALFKNNYKPTMREVANMWRNFSINDEAGTIICSYPDGVHTPAIPIPYCEETMTGFEYALAALMIAEGHLSEGEQIVKAVRDRYDGEKRNPWNEIECGSNYARSLASFSLLPIYAGFSFDMTKQHIGFHPIHQTGKFLFSLCESWGSFIAAESQYQIKLHGAPLTLSSISLPNANRITSITADCSRIDFQIQNDRIIFDDLTFCRDLTFTCI